MGLGFLGHMHVEQPPNFAKTNEANVQADALGQAHPCTATMVLSLKTGTNATALRAYLQLLHLHILLLRSAPPQEWN